MKQELLTRLLTYARHYQGLCKTECTVFDIERQQFYGGLFCRECKNCTFENTHRYGCYEAQRWGGRYIYYCPAGLVFAAAVCGEENPGRPEAGVLAGPVMMGEREDFIEKFPLPYAELMEAEPSAVNDMAEILAAGVCGGIAGKQYGEMLNGIYAAKDAPSNYPMELEKQLCAAIANGDSAQAREQLNLLLGHIFFGENGDFSAIKVRITELLVVMSRGAISGGADIHQIFMLNKKYLQEIQKLDSLEKLSAWLTPVLDQFVRYVFTFNTAKHSDVVFKIIAYIRRSYAQKITLDDIAQSVYLSRSYISKIFKAETGYSLVNYINQVRVEKSKALLCQDMRLIDVAYHVGFEDQSYYTKVFKKLTGVSPGQYKMKKGKI